MAKLHQVSGEALPSLENLRDAGASIGFDTDLMAALHPRNHREFRLRREVFSALDIQHQATSVNARPLQAEGQIGCIASGAFADLIRARGQSAGRHHPV